MTKLKIGKKTVKSPYEYDTYKHIESILPKGATIEYEPEKLEYTITYQYIPDFVITFADGRKLYIETKGNGRSFDGHVRQKMIAVKDQHPDKDIRIVFFSDGIIGGTKKRKRGGYYKQSEWSERNKYKFSIKKFNEKWLEE